MEKKLIGNRPELNTIYEDKNGILMSVNPNDKYEKDAYHVIYVNGSQEQHYTPSGKGRGLLMMGHNTWGHNCDYYSEKIIPHIQNFRVDESNDNSEQFSTSLYEGAKYLNTDKIILIGKSYGGLISLKLSDRDLIDQVVAINPVIFGSPFANKEMVDGHKWKKDPLTKIVKGQIYSTFNRELYRDNQVGFTNEKARGMDLQEINANKARIYGGSIVGLPLKMSSNIHEELAQKLAADVMYDMTGQENDSTVIWDKQALEQYGIEYTEMASPYHGNTQKSNYNRLIFHDVQKRLIKNKRGK